MTDEWDAETLAIVRGYCGHDPREPENIVVKVFQESSGRWTLKRFQELIGNAVARIPIEYLDTATVELIDEPDVGSWMTITYIRPENDAEIAENVRQALNYARERQEKDRATYERLKLKFEE